MPLPGPGNPLSINQIRNQLGTSSGSLRYLSSLAGFSTPDAISEFYGYPPSTPHNVSWSNESAYYGYPCTLSIFVNGNPVEISTVNGFSDGNDFIVYDGDVVAVNAEDTGGYFATLELVGYDTNTGYIYNNSIYGQYPYLSFSFTVTSAMGSLSIYAYDS